MLITVHIKVKFRAFFTDLFKFEREVKWAPSGVPKPPVTVEKLLVDDRGVYVHLRVE